MTISNKITPHERAAKIVSYMCPDTNIPAKDIEFIAAQIEEAYDEGFRAAKEKAAVMLKGIYDYSYRILQMEDK